MYALGTEFEWVIKVKISILFTIYEQRKSLSPGTFVEMSNIYIINKPSKFGTTRKMT